MVLSDSTDLRQESRPWPPTSRNTNEFRNNAPGLTSSPMGMWHQPHYVLVPHAAPPVQVLPVPPTGPATPTSGTAGHPPIATSATDASPSLGETGARADTVRSAPRRDRPKHRECEAKALRRDRVASRSPSPPSEDSEDAGRDSSPDDPPAPRGRDPRARATSPEGQTGRARRALHSSSVDSRTEQEGAHPERERPRARPLRPREDDGDHPRRRSRDEARAAAQPARTRSRDYDGPRHQDAQQARLGAPPRDAMPSRPERDPSSERDTADSERSSYEDDANYGPAPPAAMGHQPMPGPAPATASAGIFAALYGSKYKTIPTTLPAELAGGLVSSFTPPPKDRIAGLARAISDVRDKSRMEFLRLYPESFHPHPVSADKVEAAQQARACLAQEASYQIGVLTNATLTLAEEIYASPYGKALEQPSVASALLNIMEVLAGASGFWWSALRDAVMDQSLGSTRALRPFNNYPASYASTDVQGGTFLKDLEAARKRLVPPRRPPERSSQGARATQGRTRPPRTRGKGFPSGGSKPSAGTTGSNDRS